MLFFIAILNLSVVKVYPSTVTVTFAKKSVSWDLKSLLKLEESDRTAHIYIYVGYICQNDTRMTASLSSAETADACIE